MRRFLVILALAGCGKAPPAGSFERPPAPVVVATAAAVDVPFYLDEIGSCSARESAVIRPQVTGRLSEVHVADGADVKENAPLFTIDPRPFDAALKAVEASAAEAKASAELAAKELKRIEELVGKNAAAKQELDTAQSARDVAAARASRIEAELLTAKLQREYASIKAPFAGRAGQRLVDAGNTVKANETDLLVIQRIDSVYADFHVNEAELALVREHLAKRPLRVEVRVPGSEASPLTGELTFIDNAVRPETGTVKLRALVANEARRLWPGLFVKVRVLLDTLPAAVLVPAEAPQMSAKGPFVYVVKEDRTAEARPVTLGQKHDARVVVKSGLAAGEKVVTAGHIAIMPGGKVAPQEPPPASAEAPK